MSEVCYIPKILDFEPSLDALSLRSDATSSKKISHCRGPGLGADQHARPRRRRLV